MKFHLLAAFLSTAALLLPSPAQAQQAGKFDYYLLSLSWSPEFCHSHQSNPECGRHLGLVVHGLWPQYDNAPRGPENCGNPPGLANPSSMLDIMPTLGLVQHEWVTHGSCSGLNANDYFALLRSDFKSFHIPPQLQQPSRQAIIKASDLRRAIEQNNPGLTGSEVIFTCTGPYLKEVELCFTKDGKPQPCSSIHGCTIPSLRIPPVR